MKCLRSIMTALGGVMLCAGTAASHPGSALDKVLAAYDQDEHRDLRGVVVLHEGKVIAERYYNGETADTLHDIRSAGKSVTGLLVGIAIDQGKMHDPDDKVSTYWPEAKNSAIGDVAIKDVLTMRSGLAAFDADPASPGNEDKLDAAPDPIAFLLSAPRADPAGSRYRYNSLTAYAAGVVVAKATGSSMADFARTALFEPLGIRHWKWASDAAGYTKGQGNLSLTARDCAVIGEMVRGQGLYDGRRIVSANWIRRAVAPLVGISDSDPYAEGYGYFWYSKTQQINGQAVSVSFASGNGGNKIYVVLSRRMVIAITSSAYGKGYGQQRSEALLRSILAVEQQD